MFHQSVRSETKANAPSGAQAGWKIDSRSPPATGRDVPTDPSDATSTTASSVPSQGIRGKSQAMNATREPSGDQRGNA
jgi:hypothetical protein